MLPALGVGTFGDRQMPYDEARMLDGEAKPRSRGLPGAAGELGRPFTAGMRRSLPLLLSLSPLERAFPAWRCTSLLLFRERPLESGLNSSLRSAQNRPQTTGLKLLGTLFPGAWLIPHPFQGSRETERRSGELLDALGDLRQGTPLLIEVLSSRIDEARHDPTPGNRTSGCWPTRSATCNSTSLRRSKGSRRAFRSRHRRSARSGS